MRIVNSSNDVTLGATTSDAEDTGAATGWSIGNAVHYQPASGWTTTNSGNSIRIAIRAEAKFVDFSDLQAGHTSPIGMGSPDGSTLWVGQWFSTQVYAYNLADETANYSENWTLHNPATVSESNRKPTGIWSNGTHIYVTDPDHDRVFQYNAGDKSLTSTTYSLHADNGNRQGLWSDGTTAWVSDNADDKLYAYALSDFSRQSGKDIGLHSDNVEVRGIWSDGATIWVLDRDEEKIYAYLLSDGSRDSDLDIDLDGAGVNYNSIWSDGTTMYVVENTGGSASRDPQIHKLPLPAQSETVVWEATLALAVADTPWATVGNTNEGYGSSDSPLLSATHGTLSPDSFTVGGTTHTVEILAYQTGSTPQLLFFTDTGVTKADLEGLELRITVASVAKTLAVSSATDFSSGGTNYGIYWEDSSHGYRLYDWAGKTVTVQLRTPNNPATGALAITGTAQVGETLTAATSGIADTDGLTSPTYTYQWIRVDGATESDISGATSSTYTLVDADEGKTIKVKVSFTDDASNAETLTSAATAAVAAVDDCAADATTTCNVSLGSSVTGDIEISGDDDYFRISVTSGVTYQFYVEGSDTSRGTLRDPEMQLLKQVGSVYNLVDFDSDDGEGRNARLVWTADGTFTRYVWVYGYSGTGTYTLTVSAANTPATGAPTITGTAQVGQTLTAATSGIMDSDGLTSPTYAYQWIRVDSGTDTDISGATSSAYTLVAADLGKTIKVKVSFTDDAGNAETLTSAATAAAEAKPNTPATGQPTISGTAQVGQTLTADTSAIADADGLTNAVFSYQWLADGAEISGTTGSTYTLADADEDKAISVAVSFTDDAGNAETLTSAATVVVAAKPNTPATGEPTINGTAQVGQTLAADTSGIADEDGLTNAVFSYQWLADGAEISGTTGSTYTLVDADEGKAISVAVSFTDDAGNDETLTSAASAAVEAAPLPPLTASLENVATSHDGERVFTFELRFSEEFGLSYKTLRDHAFTVTGGTVKKA